MADDGDDVRRWLRVTLEARGWSVTDADSGDKALALFDRADPPDVVVLDHMMPGMTGPEVAQRLRAEGYDGPVVLFSADLSGDTSSERRGLRVVPVDEVDHTTLFRVTEAAATGRAAPEPRGTST